MTSPFFRLAVFAPAIIATMLCAPPLGLYAQVPGIPQDAIVINLDTNGTLRLDQQQIDLRSLPDRLRGLTATHSDAAVVIVAAADVAFKELVKVVETVRSAGIERVGILKSQPDSFINEALPPAGVTVLCVDRSAVVRLDGKIMKLNGLAAQLRKVYKRRIDHTVYIRAYGALPFDIVGNVIDAAKAAGASRIALLASSD